MADVKKLYQTDDPILLAALNATDTEIKPKAPRSRRGDGSPYAGISNKKSKNGKWRSSLGVGRREYNLGDYDTDHEAALARNYAEGLVPGAKRVNNQIPPEKIPPDVQKQVAKEVIGRLRGYGVLPAPERNGEQAPEAPAGAKPSDAQPSPAQGRPTTVAVSERTKQQLQDMLRDTAEGSLEGE